MNKTAAKEIRLYNVATGRGATIRPNQAITVRQMEDGKFSITAEIDGDVFSREGFTSFNISKLTKENA